MWIVLIAVIVFILFRFVISAKKDSDKIKSEGGIRHKYSTLIDYFLSGHPSARILQETNSFVSVGVTGAAGSTIYYVTQSGNTVLIRMEIKNNPLYGNVKMNWSFPDTAPQEDMLNNIEYDLSKKINELNSRF